MIEIALVIPVILWFFAVKIVSKSKFIWHFIISNIAIAVAGFYIILKTNIIDVGTNSYGFGTLLEALIFGFGHSIVGLLYGIFLKMYQNKPI